MFLSSKIFIIIYSIKLILNTITIYVTFYFLFWFGRLQTFLNLLMMYLYNRSDIGSVSLNFIWNGIYTNFEPWINNRIITQKIVHDDLYVITF